jgi:hypothetical protein
VKIDSNIVNRGSFKLTIVSEALVQQCFRIHFRSAYIGERKCIALTTTLKSVFTRSSIKLLIWFLNVILAP